MTRCSEREALVIQWDAFACRIAVYFWKQTRFRLEKDDLLGVARLALWKAALGWKDGIAPFPAYAKRAVFDDLKRYVRRELRGGLTIMGRGRQPCPAPKKFSEIESDGADDQASYDRTLADHRGPLPDDEEFWTVRVRPLLDDREYAVLSAYHREGMTYEEIGVRMGVKRQWVHQIAKKANQKLRARPDAFPR